MSEQSDLPINQRREDLLAAISAHQVVIVAGETGSGKSTQLPQICLELGLGAPAGEGGREGRLIGHTQPRRIAARSIAERIAEETGTTLGDLVGYQVRFNEEVGPNTRIKVMTDGILLAEIQRDRTLSRYDTLIIDEAHERSLNIDFLLGYLRQLLAERPDLKVIITSATIDTERFSQHFDDAPIIAVEGRTYPVEIRYRPLDDATDPDGETLDQAEGICAAVEELRRSESGDVLVFCSGEREIREAAAALEDLGLADTEIFPLYARLSSAEQHRVFESHRGRRIVLATNVAETSLTVPGIRSVIDPGTARVSRYSARTKVQRLPIEPVSQASANQRAGRCGRVGPGVCIRLYSEEDFASRPEFTEPEIRRTNLASVILQMAALGLGEAERFPFVDPPSDRNIRDGVALLEELDAVDPERAGTRKWLTPIGRKLARLPIDPRLGRMVIDAAENGCLHEVMVIASAMSIQDPRERPMEQRPAADASHARFAHPTSDFLSYLNLWNHLEQERRERSSNQFRKMCRQEFLNHNRIREWRDIYSQLLRTARTLGFRPNTVDASADQIHLSLLAGLLSHIGVKDSSGREFIGARQARFSIAAGSSLHKNAPAWVMAGELVETNRLWARTAARSDPLWAERLGAHLVKRSYGEPTWDPTRGAATTHERVTLYGLVLVPGRRVQLSRIDPAEAREMFIFHGLVEGEWDMHHPFMDRNAEVIAEAATIEARARRNDLVAEADAIFAFYEHRLPDSVTSGAAFNSWWKQARREDPALLDLAVSDLVDLEAAAIDPHLYPEEWLAGDLQLAISYEFDSTSHSDGVTITIPAAVLGRLDPALFEWNVPGLRDELVTELIRSLPKPIRKVFVPVPETIALIRADLDPARGGLVEVVRAALNRLIDEPLPVDSLRISAVADHLRPNFRVVDAEGTTLAEGRDLDAIRARLADRLRAEVRAVVAEVGAEFARTGLRTWDLDALPRVIEHEADGHRVRAYPALVDEQEGVGIAVFASPDEQTEAMWAGTRRLLRLQMPSPARQVDSLLDAGTKRRLANDRHQPRVEWYHDCINCTLDHLIAEGGGPAWNRAAFKQLVEGARAGFADTLAAVCSSATTILSTLGAIDTALARASATAPLASVTDARHHLERLVYPGFLTGVGFDRLGDLTRYLKAIERRAAAMTRNPARDASLMATCVQLEVEYDRLVATTPWSDELELLAYQLEEFRVSSFAQELGTASPVSEKRLRTEMHRLARGG